MDTMSLPYDKLPPLLRDGMKLYIEHGIQPGSFLRAVIINDLRLAVIRADNDNLVRLREILLWFDSHAPAGCWGSPEIMRDWLVRHQQRKETAL